MALALSDVRILDLTQYEAGTSSTQALGWLGAQIVKVEPPGRGEPGRRLGAGSDAVDSTYFITLNNNKRSLTLDLKSDGGREIFKQLVPKFDIVVENFTLGTMERLGIGYDTLKEIHPQLIYCTVKGLWHNRTVGAHEVVRHGCAGGRRRDGDHRHRGPHCPSNPARPSATLAPAYRRRSACSRGALAAPARRCRAKGRAVDAGSGDQLHPRADDATRGLRRPRAALRRRSDRTDRPLPL